MAKSKDNHLTTPISQLAIIDKPEEKPIKYVVVRDGHRVSDKEYESLTDPLCIEEIKFWSEISNVRSHGEKVEVVQYDPKKHRVW